MAIILPLATTISYSLLGHSDSRNLTSHYAHYMERWDSSFILTSPKYFSFPLGVGIQISYLLLPRDSSFILTSPKVMGFKFHSYFSQLPHPSPLGHGVQDSHLLPPSFPKLVVRFTLVLSLPHSSLLNLFNTLTLLNIFYYFIIPLTGLASITT